MPDSDWLKLSAPHYCEEGRTAALEYLAGAPSNMDPEGPRGQFEAALARHLNVPASWVIATNSGTGALATACRLLDTEGRGIEAPVLTWPATYAHASANLVDAGPCTEDRPDPQWSREPGKARVAVALWGVPAPAPLAPGPLILDAAHAFGAGVPALNNGGLAAVCYSFGPLKEVPCSRGGALVSPRCADPRWRAFTDSGTLGRHGVIPHGFNFQMGEPECVLGTHQLAHAAEWKARRQELLRWYVAYWSELGVADHGRLLTHAEEASGHVCVARADTPWVREQWRAQLLADHIQCGVHYELPLWAPAVRWPNAWDWSQRVLSLPCHLGVTEADVRRVCENLLL